VRTHTDPYVASRCRTSAVDRLVRLVSASHTRIMALGFFRGRQVADLDVDVGAGRAHLGGKERCEHPSRVP